MCLLCLIRGKGYTESVWKSFTLPVKKYVLKCASVCDFREVMEKSFPDYYDYYEGICKNNMHQHGETMQVKLYFSCYA